ELLVVIGKPPVRSDGENEAAHTALRVPIGRERRGDRPIGVRREFGRRGAGAATVGELVNGGRALREGWRERYEDTPEGLVRGPLREWRRIDRHRFSSRVDEREIFLTEQCSWGKRNAERDHRSLRSITVGCEGDVQSSLRWAWRRGGGW